MRSALLLALCISPVAAGDTSSAPAPRPATAAQRQKRQVGEVLGLLARMPIPGQMGSNDAANREKCMEAVKKIHAYPTNIIRHAEVAFLWAHGDSGVRRFRERELRGAAPSISDCQGTKLHLMHRYIFAVPAREPKRAEFFDSFGIIDPHGGKENYMRPLWLDQAGQVSYDGRYVGMMGPSYRALAEFDYFNRRFGRRRIPPASQK